LHFYLTRGELQLKYLASKNAFGLLHFYLTRGELQFLICVPLSVSIFCTVAFLSDPWGVAIEILGVEKRFWLVAFLSDPWGVAISSE